jgi:CRISPR-associated protein Csm4
MKTLKLTLRPLAHFGTPLAGDTLFGHLCWAVRERQGERHLTDLLDGYTAGHPFLVVSDAFPNGFLPRPTAPEALLGQDVEPAARKVARERRWLPTAEAHLPLGQWITRAQRCDFADSDVLTQNTINRITGTTGAGQFAPRQIERTAYRNGTTLHVYAVFDESGLDVEAVRRLFDDVGAVGYGRDASTGLGKFAVESISEHRWPSQSARHWLTLAPCAPEIEALDTPRCYYHPLTRFGRHGNLGVRLGAPFKRPLLMMKTGALLTARQAVSWVAHGRGLGGRASPLSFVIPDTVHQGYAPVVPLNAELA